MTRLTARTILALLLAAAALVLLPTSGLAQSPAQTRVGASVVLASARAGDFTPLAAVSQLGKAHAYDENASGSLLAAEGAAPALSAGERVALNQGLGNAWRDEVAMQFDQMPNRMASTEVTKFTPFGRRVIDVEVSDANGQVLGGIETKFGNSPYTVMQQWKDMWLQYFQGYRVNVLRYPG